MDSDRNSDDPRDVRIKSSRSRADVAARDLFPRRRLVTVIGIDDYVHLPKLRCAVGDALGIQKLLVEKLGFQAPIAPLLDAAATKRAIESLVADELPSRLDERDALVLFFAGHGTTRSARVSDKEVVTGYLAPVEARGHSHFSELVELEHLLRQIAILPARHVLVVLDACHSGIALGAAAFQYRSLDRFVRTLTARTSRRVLTSARGDEVARDSGPVPGHSLFTGTLVEALASGDADIDGNGIITSSELALFLQQKVGQATGSQQTPDYGAFHLDNRGELVIVGTDRDASSSSQPDAQSPRPAAKRALLVGVSECESGFEALPAAARDVAALREALEQPVCGFEVTSLVDPDLQSLLNALDAFFGGADRADLLLFYYAGHVRLNESKNLCLTARNSALGALTPTTLTLSRLAEDFLNACPAEHLLFVLDGSYGDAGREPVEAALKTYLGQGRSKVLVAAGAGPLGGSLVRALDLDVRSVDANRDRVVTAAEIVDYMTRELVQTHQDLRPILGEFHAVAGEIALQGRGQPPRPALTPEQEAFVRRLAPELDQGTVIPFLGDGIYGGGPLSFSWLAGALLERAGLPGARTDIGIATAAESLELQREDRGQFLRELLEILGEQASRCEPRAAHDLVLDMNPPWLVVTVNYDDLLEQRLVNAKRPHVVICHILRSGGDPLGDEDEEPTRDEHAGKILVLRSPDHPEVLRDPARAAEIQPSDGLALRPDDCVIYRLLGAPFINDLPFCRQRSLDTVVITETDHIDFLTKLRDPRTGVPRTIVSRMFRKRKLLFLEYSLDIWHYRLVSRVFRKNDAPEHGNGSVTLLKTPYLVRTDTTPMENHFWRRLTPDRVSMKLPALVRALRAPKDRLR